MQHAKPGSLLPHLMLRGLPTKPCNHPAKHDESVDKELAEVPKRDAPRERVWVVPWPQGPSHKLKSYSLASVLRTETRFLDFPATSVSQFSIRLQMFPVRPMGK